MKKVAYLLIVGLILGTGLSASIRGQSDVPRPAYASDRIKIKLSSSALSRANLPSGLYAASDAFGITELDQLFGRNGGTQVIRAHRQVSDRAWEQNTGFDRWFIVMLDGRTDVKEAITNFRSSPYVEEAIPEYFAYTMAIPNDPYYANNWGHNNTAQLPKYVSGSHSGAGVGTIGFDSHAQLAWDQSQGYGSASVVIAIIDTGVDTAHPDLRLVTGYDYGDNDSNPMDDSADPGHGTACSGVAAGIANNGIGVTGVAGGCSVMPLKIASSDGSLGFTAIENALIHAGDNNVDVASMSFGAEGGTAEGDSPSTDAALEYAYSHGVTLLAATANSNASTMAYPSNHNKVISVGAASPTGQRKSTTSSDGENWWGSNYGVNTQDDKNAVDIMAPTILPATDITGSGGSSTTDYSMWFNGTSCATPYAAGVAALIISKYPSYTPAQVRAAMVSTATDMTFDGGVGWDRYTGYGMVNAYQALIGAQAPAAITWNPVSLSQDLAPESTAAQTLTIGNTGEMTLNYTLSKQLNPSTFPNDGFESYPDFAIAFSPWTLVDVDLSNTYGIANYTWTNAGVPQAYMVFNPGSTTPPIAGFNAFSGSKYAACFASTTAPNNDWLISPLLTPVSGDMLGFYARSYTAQHGLERFKVGVSTGSTNPNDFTIISGTNYLEAPVNWINYAYNLSAYAGQSIRFAIQCLSNNAFVFMVDDVSVSSNSNYTPSWITVAGGNTVSGSVDGVSKDTDIISIGFNSAGLQPGTYSTSLSLISNSSNNPSISIPVTLQIDQPLPVALSSFTAATSAENFINLTWVTQTETGVQGFYVLRNTSDELATALTVSEMIQATNSSMQQTYLFTDRELFEEGTYYYWLQNSDLDGSTDFHGPISAQYTAVGSETPVIPLVTQLNPAYPNPFNPNTTISYTLAEPGSARLEIYNQRGQLVWTRSQEHPSPGHYRHQFDSRDLNGTPLASGVYLYRLISGQTCQVRKMVLSK